MKLSVSLSDEDVAFLDNYARARGLRSRSAALHKAVQLLPGAELSAAYASAFREWDDTGEAEAWGPTVADGLESETAR